MMEVADKVGHLYEILPRHISPTDTVAYTDAISTRIQHLVNNFNFMHFSEAQQDYMHPVIKEGLIRLLWLTPLEEECIGELYASDFADIIPYWLLTNFGISVRRSH